MRVPIFDDLNMPLVQRHSKTNDTTFCFWRYKLVVRSVRGNVDENSVRIVKNVNYCCKIFEIFCGISLRGFELQLYHHDIPSTPISMAGGVVRFVNDDVRPDLQIMMCKALLIFLLNYRVRQDMVRNALMQLYKKGSLKPALSLKKPLCRNSSEGFPKDY